MPPDTEAAGIEAAAIKPPDIEAIAEQVFAALADPTRAALPARAGRCRAGYSHRPGRPAAHHPAGDRQAPGPAGRGGTGHSRAGGAPPGALPAPLGPPAARAPP